MHRRASLLLALLALCVGVGVSSAPKAHAAKHMEVAIADDDVFLWALRSPFTGLRKAKALHVTWIRVSMPWAAVMPKKQAHARKAPKRVKYRWRRWDDIVRRARARGMAVQFQLLGPAPRWASKKPRHGTYHRGFYKPGPKRFAAFAGAAAKHFKGRVKRWEVWNEPNFKTWLQPSRSSARIYREMYTRAYGKINAVAKKNQVLFGDTAPHAERRFRNISPLLWLRRVACVNANYRHRRCKHPLRTDGYAHHAYDVLHAPTYRWPGRDDVTLATLYRLNRALRKLRRSRALLTPHGGTPQVYITEYGYFSGANTKRSRKFRISKKKHARYLRKAFSMARKNKHVKQMLQYLLVEPRRSYYFRTQIMSRKFKPYPAYTALRKWTAYQARHHGIKTKP
jgi:hypothetical protein